MCVCALLRRDKMNNTIEILRIQVVLAFVATCVETTARHLGVSYKEVYDRMKKVGMIENYIYPNYEALHTESRENVVRDMVQCLTQWEARG